MSCSDVCASVDLWDYETCDLHAQTTPRAIKRHVCSECGGDIVPGVKYERVAGLCDGAFFTTKTCAECLEIRGKLFCGGWVYGSIWELIEEQVFPEFLRVSPMECLAQIESRAARDKLEGAFNEWREGGPHD